MGPLQILQLPLFLLSAQALARISFSQELSLKVQNGGDGGGDDRRK